ncbi:Chloramphenicol resistance protein [Durusdinium trenchii]|uniref:Chloramphenicol resistance protein n=1 Tax=Durusdinium trenchii TaxID=1381693 RepID=A0ABP0HBX8_9DINO
MTLFEPVAAVTDSDLVQELQHFRPALQAVRLALGFRKVDDEYRGNQVVSARELLNGDPMVEDYEDVPTTTDHVLSYIFTSGSTGKSKCVVATNRMAWAECQWYPELFEKLGYKVDPKKDCSNNSDRWRLDHEMGWWGAAFFGEVDVALAMAMCIVMMKPTDPDWGQRGVTVSGALPSQLTLGIRRSVTVHGWVVGGGGIHWAGGSVFRPMGPGDL